MEKRLTADLNVVSNSNLEIQLLDGDLNIIQKLDDEPNDVGGLTSAELKAKFDESGNIIKKYINETLIPAVLTDDATEESRKQAEAARVAAEQGRVTAEEGRVSAESGRVSAEQARANAEASRVSAETARVQAETARADETAGIVARATAQANAAAGSASQAAGSEQAAQSAANTASSAASSASQSAATASGSASQAQASAAAAAQSAASVDRVNKTAQSWAVGGTGTRPGEDTDNAKYWAQQAQTAVGGDFATKTEAQGYVTEHNQSNTAHPDIRTAVAGSVRYDAAQTLSDEQKTQARENINSAPGGFGLGEAAKMLTASDNVDNVKKNGWYTWHWDPTRQPAGLPDEAKYHGGLMRVDSANPNTYDNVQTIYIILSPPNTNPGDQCVIQRMGLNAPDIWNPWEWINPPMLLGVEYRTTERYLGKPVYCKLVNFGALPNKTSKSVEFSSDAAAIIKVDVLGTSGQYLSLYDIFSSIAANITEPNRAAVILKTIVDASDTNAYCYVKYTKTTD